MSDLRELDKKIIELQNDYFKNLSKFDNLRDFFEQKKEISNGTEISEFLCILVKDKALNGNFKKSEFKLIDKFISEKQGGIHFELKIDFSDRKIKISYLSSERSGPWMMFDCKMDLFNIYSGNLSDMKKCVIETFIEDEDRRDPEPRNKHKNADEIKGKVKELFDLLRKKYASKKA